MLLMITSEGNFIAIVEGIWSRESKISRCH